MRSAHILGRSSLLATAVLLFSGAGCRPRPPPVDENGILRWWSFEEVRQDRQRFSRIGDERFQVGGAVDETIEVGSLAFNLPDTGSPVVHAQVFSGEGGATYWVSAEAPAVATERIGTAAVLEQRQYFRKLSEDASLSLRIVATDLLMIDSDPSLPSPTECTWRKGPSFVDCARVMNAWVDLDVSALTMADGRQLARWAGLAEQFGWLGAFDTDVYTLAQSMPLWTPDRFSFDPDVTSTGGTTARATLDGTIQLDVPLGTVTVGEVFVVTTKVKASTLNLRRGESYARAFFRDPLSAEGLETTHAGLEPVDAPDDEVPPLQPLTGAPCATPDPAAGTIQFDRAAFSGPELPGPAGTVLVTRSGLGQGEVSVTLTASNGTAEAGADFEPLTTTVFFGDGEVGTRAVLLSLVLDSTGEPDETVNLTLSAPMGCAELGPQSTAVLNILDDDTPLVGPTTYEVGGTVSGSIGTGLRLTDVVTGSTVTPGNGVFTFPYAYPDASGYDVRVTTQPSDPAQSCTVTNGEGTIATANVTNVSVVCVASTAAAGLDPTFSTDGKAGVTASAAKDLVVQGDGKIVWVGGSTVGRLNADGTLDSDFGTGGMASFSFGQPQDEAHAVVLQPDGKIVVVGLMRTAATQHDFAVARYESNGALDLGFGGGDGKVSTDFGGFTDRAHAVAIQPGDGKIVVAGFGDAGGGDGSDFAVVRYTAAGEPDPDFGGGDGRVNTNVLGLADFGYGLVLQPDGKIIVVGRAGATGSSNPNVGLVRYLANGTVDASFDGGVVHHDFASGGWDEAPNVVLQSDGKLVLAVQAQLGAQFELGAARFHGDGTVDSDFGEAGLAHVAFSTSHEFAWQVEVDGSGRILLAGQGRGTTNDFGIVRLTSAGAPDPTFSDDGKLLVDFFGSNDGANCLALTGDGEIVVGGLARNGSTNGVGVARLVP